MSLTVPRNQRSTVTIADGGAQQPVFNLPIGAILTMATARPSAVGGPVRCTLHLGIQAGVLKGGWIRNGRAGVIIDDSFTWTGWLPLGGLPAADQEGPTVVFNLINDTGAAVTVQLRVDYALEKRE